MTQGFSYGPYARELDTNESGRNMPEEGDDDDDNSYVSASVSEYSEEERMMEEPYI